MVDPARFSFQALADSSPFLRALLENTLDVLVLVDREGRVLFVSPSVERHFGFQPQDLVGNDFLALVHPEDITRVRRRVAQGMTQADDNTPLEPVRAMNRAGEWRWVEAIAVSRFEQDDFAGLLITVRDVTAHVLAAETRERVRTMEHEQRAFVEAMREAAGVVSRGGEYEEILDALMRTLARIVPFETASIFIRDGDVLRVARASGFERYGLGDWIKRVTFPADLPKLRRLLETPAPAIVKDTRTDPEWIQLPEDAWIRSHISVPIQLGADPVGMLGLDSPAVNFYTPEHGDRLMAFAALAAAALRNARLLGETRQRAREFEMLYETTRDLAMPNETARLVETIVERAMQLLSTPVGFLYTYDAPAQELALMVCRGMELPDGYRTALSTGGVVGQVALQQKPMLENDYQQSPFRVAGRAVQDIRQVIGSPVIYGGNLIGVLGLADRSPARRFDEDELSLLTLFAGHAAAALETARLLQETRQRAEQLALLYDVGLTLNRVIDSHAQLNFFFNIARRALHCERMAFFRYNPERQELVYAQGVGVPPDTEAELHRSGLSVPKGEGLVGWVARERIPVRLGTVDNDPRWLAVDPRVKASLAVPIEHENELQGVLIASSESYNTFSAQDERLLILFSNQVAVALENSRRNNEMRRQLRDADLLHRAGQALTRTLSFADTVERLADFFMEAVQVQACCISTLDLERGEMVVILDRDPLPETRVPPGTQYRIVDYPYLIDLVGTQGSLVLHRSTPGLDPVVAREMDGYRWQSILLLPLTVGEQVIGVVELADQFQHHEFSPDTLRLAESLAHQAASALQNARLYEETRRRAEQLGLLNRIARAASGARTIEELLDLIERETLPLIPSESFYVALYDDTREQVDFRRFVDNRVKQPPFVWQLKPSLTRQVIMQKQGLCIDERAELFLPDNPPQFFGSGPANRSWLGVPMRLGERVVGVISLQSVRPHAYSATDAQLLQTIADQVAIAVDRVRSQEPLAHAEVRPVGKA